MGSTGNFSLTHFLEVRLLQPIRALEEEEEVFLGAQPTVWEVKRWAREISLDKNRFPQPGLLGKRSPYAESHFFLLFFQAGRKSAVECSQSMVNVHSWGSAEANAHPWKISCLQKSCPSVCRCRVHLSQPRYNHQLSPVRLWLKTVPKFFLLCGNPDFRSLWIFPLPSSESGSLLLYKVSPVCLTLHVSKELPQALVSHSLGSLKCFRLCFGTLILIFLGVGAGKGVTGEAAAFPMNVNWAQSWNSNTLNPLLSCPLLSLLKSSQVNDKGTSDMVTVPWSRAGSFFCFPEEYSEPEVAFTGVL